VLVLIEAEPPDLRFECLPWNAEFRGSSRRPLPQSIADEGHRRTAGAVLRRRKRAAHGCTDAEEREQPCRSHARAEALRIAAAGEGDRSGARCFHAFKGAALVAPVDKVLIGSRKDRKLALLEHEHEPRGVSKGERAQQDRIHDTEDGRIGSDTERQRQDRDCGKAGIVFEHSQTDSQILHTSASLEAINSPARDASTLGDSMPEPALCDNSVRFRHDLPGFQRRMVHNLALRRLPAVHEKCESFSSSLLVLPTAAVEPTLMSPPYLLKPS
jgi:hypothetical protein